MAMTYLHNGQKACVLSATLFNLISMLQLIAKKDVILQANISDTGRKREKQLLL